MKQYQIYFKYYLRGSWHFGYKNVKAYSLSHAYVVADMHPSLIKKCIQL